jgi:hypothetical protein
MGLSRSALRALTEPRGSLAPRPTTGSRKGRWKASGTDKRSRAMRWTNRGSARGKPMPRHGARISDNDVGSAAIGIAQKCSPAAGTDSHRRRCCFHEQVATAASASRSLLGRTRSVAKGLTRIVAADRRKRSCAGSPVSAVESSALPLSETRDLSCSVSANREEIRVLGRAPAPSMRATAPDRLLTGASQTIGKRLVTVSSAPAS